MKTMLIASKLNQHTLNSSVPLHSITRRGFRIIVILLILMMALAWGACGGPKTTRSKGKAKQPAQAQSQTEEVVRAVQTSDNSSTTIAAATLNLPPKEFGREDPFMPLVIDAKSIREEQLHVGRNVTEEFSPPEVALPKSIPQEFQSISQKTESEERGSVIRLTLIIGETTAVFEENGVSRSVSVGDTIAGMEVLEIGKGEVVLGKGDKRYTVTLGTLSKI